jgi:hypothetical protein
VPVIERTLTHLGLRASALPPKPAYWQALKVGMIDF